MKRKSLGGKIRSLLFCLVAVASASTLNAESLKVLAIGNSFTGSLNMDLPRIAKDCGCELEYCLLIVGGCSMMRQMELADLAADDATYAPWNALFNYKAGTTFTCRDGKVIPLCNSLVPVMRAQKDGSAAKPRWDANIHKVLAGEKWDVVVIQQSSQASWKASTYEPWAGEMIKLIKSKAPQAKIMLQQTWSYNELCPRLKNWGMTSKEMYKKLTAAYLATAKRHGLEIIPTGKAFELYRAKKPVLSPIDDVVGQPATDGVMPRDGEKFDAVHASTLGCYLQSCVWVAKLFGSDLAKAKLSKPLVQRGYSLDLIRACALEAVKWSEEAKEDVRIPDCGIASEPEACRPASRFVSAPWWTARLAEKRRTIAQAKGACYDLVLVGDSITHRWENKDNGAKVYPKLKERFKVLNLGSGGDKTQNVIWRFENNGELDDYTAKVFAVMIGVNNGPADPDGTVAGVKKIVEMIRAKHPESKILLQAILPHGKAPRNAVSARVINPKLKVYAEKSGCAWLDMTEKFLGEDGEIKSGLMMPDDLHPVKGGYEIWLAELTPVVEKMLECR